MVVLRRIVGYTSKDIHHYEVPNFSNSKFIMQTLVLYDYTNREKDIIAEAFRTGNCNFD